MEKIAGASIRHSAQTVFGIIILGVGPIMAGFYNQLLLSGLFDVKDGPTNYHGVWAVQSGVAVLAMLALAVAFHYKPPRAEETTAAEHHEGRLS